MANPLDALLHVRRLAGLLQGPIRIGLVRAGLDAGLFEALREPKDAEELAHALGAPPDLVAAWVRAATADGLLEESGGRRKLSSFAAWLIDPEEGEMRRAVLDQAALSYGPVLERLPSLLAGAARPVWGDEAEAERVAAGSRLTEGRSLAVLRRVPGVKEARRILDIGCGQGSYLRALLTRQRDASAVGVELDAGVAERARSAVHEAELQRRCEIFAGDFLELELPAGRFDLVLLNNNLHYFSGAGRRQLVTRVLERLVPGGVLAIQTPVVSDDRLARWTGMATSLAAFDLFLRSHENLFGLPDPAALVAMLREVGFAENGSVPIVPGGPRYVWARAAADS